jgi:hypothetical protein
MTLPTVRAVAKKYDTKIDYGTDFVYLDGALPKIIQGNNYIGNIVPWTEIDIDNYDAVIDLTCPCVAHEVPLARPINRIDLFARHVGIQLEDHSIDYHITEDEKKWAEDYFYREKLSRWKMILVQPFSTTTSRDFPPERMKAIIASILATQKDLRILLLTHDTDSLKPTWDLPGVHRAHNLKARQIAALMTLCPLVICPDSLILHLASALHRPTVTLFGPTDPRARINYHPEAVAIWPAGHLKTYPRWYDQSCPDGGICWKLIDLDLVRDTSLAILNKKPLPQSNDLVFFGPYQQEQPAPRIYKV